MGLDENRCLLVPDGLYRVYTSCLIRRVQTGQQANEGGEQHGANHHPGINTYIPARGGFYGVSSSDSASDANDTSRNGDPRCLCQKLRLNISAAGAYRNSDPKV